MTQYWIYYYYMGMLKYDTENKNSGDIFHVLQCILDELLEFKDSIIKLEFWDSLEELCDVIHTILRLVPFISLKVPYIGYYIYRVTLLVPVIAWVTAKKHGLRFKDKGCIRSNRHCLNEVKDHVCDVDLNQQLNKNE